MSSLDDSKDSCDESASEPSIESRRSAAKKIKRVSFLADILDRKEKIGADYAQAVDESVKKIKGLLNLRNKKTEKSIELRYDKHDLQDSVQNIKEEAHPYGTTIAERVL